MSQRDLHSTELSSGSLGLNYCEEKLPGENFTNKWNSKDEYSKNVTALGLLHIRCWVVITFYKPAILLAPTDNSVGENSNRGAIEASGLIGDYFANVGRNSLRISGDDNVTGRDRGLH